MTLSSLSKPGLFFGTGKAEGPRTGARTELLRSGDPSFLGLIRINLKIWQKLCHKPSPTYGQNPITLRASTYTPWLNPSKHVSSFPKNSHPIFTISIDWPTRLHAGQKSPSFLKGSFQCSLQCLNLEFCVILCQQQVYKPRTSFYTIPDHALQAVAATGHLLVHTYLISTKSYSPFSDLHRT